MGMDGRNSARITTTLTKRQLVSLKRLAKANGVKEAWIVRRSVEKFLEQTTGNQLPLDFKS